MIVQYVLWSQDTTHVNQQKYQTIVDCLIQLLLVRSEIQLAVIMAATHNADSTQGDLVKLIRILAYLKGTLDLGPTFYTTGVAILHAECDAAFCVHPKTGGSQFSVFSASERPRQRST
jgi:hypothetical protein